MRGEPGRSWQRPVFVLACVFLAWATPAAAQESPAFDDAQLDALLKLQTQVETLDDLERRGLIDPAVASAERTRDLDQAAAVAARALTLQELRALRRPAEQGRWAGYFTFVNLLWLIVGVLLVVALGWLAALYLVPLIARLPRWVIEVFLYAACVALVVAPRSLLSGGAVLALAVTGCLGVLPLAAWTHDLHFKRRRDEVMVRIYALLFGLAWGAAGLLHHSSLIATGSVIAFTTLTGAMVVPLLDLAVHADKKVVPAATLASLLVLVFFGGLAVTGARVPWIGEAVEVFRPGSLWVGTLVYFSGCMTLASRYYQKQLVPALVGNGIAIVSGVLGLYVGSLWGIDVLREESGTFLGLYLLFKFLELPWKRHGWAWASLLLAGLLYAFAQFAERYPEYFLGF